MPSAVRFASGLYPVHRFWDRSIARHVPTLRQDALIMRNLLWYRIL